MVRFTFTGLLDPDGSELEPIVTYSVTPGCPAQIYGDYPHPGDDSEVELISVSLDGKPMSLTDDDEAELLRQCNERAGEDLAEEACAAAEYRAELRADDRMMERLT